MELKYKAIACFLIGIFSLSGCTSTFDDLNTNPDTTTKVNASMLASKVILDMTKSASNWRNEFLVKRMFWGEQIDDGQYNRFGKGSFDNIQTLTNAWKMVELSSEDDLTCIQNLKPTTTKNHCIKLWIANGEELTMSTVLCGF